MSNPEGYLIRLGGLLLTVCLGLVQASGQAGRVRRVEPQKNTQTQTDTQENSKTVETRDAPPEPKTLDVIKVDSNLVSVPVIVSDREGRYVPNLKVQSFELFDNDARQKISYFDAAEEPLNIALLLDTSRSTEGVLDAIKKGAKSFLDELRPQDRAMIVSFDYSVHHLCELTNDRKVLEQAIKNAKVGETPGTTLNDAVMDVTGKAFKSVTGRKAIILLSDGQDFGSVTPQDVLLDQESESDTMVYSIYYQSDFRGLFRHGRGQWPGRFPGRYPRGGGRGIPPGLPILNQAPGQWPGRGQRRNGRGTQGADFMRELSDITSGRFYQSELTDLKQTFSLIAEELRHQYRLGFYPVDIKKDGSLHQLRVKVDAADLAVRARQQYRAQ
jgi:VWFA-related protein